MAKITATEQTCVEETKKTKVYIVGFAPSWKLTPWEDDEAEIWTLNEAYKLFVQEPKARVDRWFEIHNLTRPPKNKPEHIEYIKQLPIPLYTLKAWDFLPSCIPFPFTAITDWFQQQGHIGYRYFTNTISWLLGFAIMEGFTEIHLYGVDMAQDRDANGNDEYGYQKPSCEYFLGVAEKYGKVYVPKTSDLLYCERTYANELDNDSYVWIKKQIGELSDRSKKYIGIKHQSEQAVLQNEIALAEVRGAKEAYRQILRKRL